MKNISPLRYPGGKSQVYDYVRELVIANDAITYIEPYMGGMGIALKLLLNNNVHKIMVNDYDKAIYAFWYSVLNYTEQLIEKINTTPITIDEWKLQREVQKNKNNCDDLLTLGFSTLFLNRTNRSGIIKAGVIGGLKQDGNYKLDCRFNKEKTIKKIKLIASYKKQIKLYNMDAEKFIRLNITKTKNSFTFFDPPYYTKGPGLYTNFYNHENHHSLSSTIKHYMSNKNWILTYDLSEEIFQMYKEFKYEKYYLNYSVTKPSKGIEYIFYSNGLAVPENTINIKKAN
ncbi:TPA: DNA adenine methylase [Streptococcus pyogenes]|uniref:DNA adenine methylase n=3 Tax=Streptococcus pyogenes TaxID=1314 RepID=UPI0003C7A660|nr:DNA adenine methylase [Streptococcus pyogenes]HER4535349.1 DNA adenine methylase [Streptococcus pyogenes NGAS757]HER4586707.1 DNA adenine methylase [Streptococcus pyogenes NGAS615]HER4595198.1 DNA adenine methylase [Streptococcus pyogenes NGAS613]HER4602055.1 DNA adenine methylase [Streptococcus pyogenes NGAS608]HER4605206.1 DNA adenine methylase [Streptococcus pyogenes NGAS609]HER4608625.1 DNA adenine methylase [Streptococcus pyogenes NGAS601]HER4613827.1 DNA adenine methylase [Streptoco